MVLGPDHPKLAMLLSNQAFLLLEQVSALSSKAAGGRNERVHSMLIGHFCSRMFLDMAKTGLFLMRC